MFSFEILREKYVIQARPSKIDSLVHVRRLAAMLHIPYSYFPKCFLRSSLAQGNVFTIWIVSSVRNRYVTMHTLGRSSEKKSFKMFFLLVPSWRKDKWKHFENYVTPSKLFAALVIPSASNIPTLDSLLVPVHTSLRSDEGPTLETSAFKILTVTNLRYQLSW